MEFFCIIVCIVYLFLRVDYINKYISASALRSQLLVNAIGVGTAENLPTKVLIRIPTAVGGLRRLRNRRWQRRSTQQTTSRRRAGCRLKSSTDWSSHPAAVFT